MNLTMAPGAIVAAIWLTGCAGHESPDAQLEPQGVAEGNGEQYRISVEIPVDDVYIERGEDLDVDALLDERTAFVAADFNLREVVLIARSRSDGADRSGGSAKLIVGAWASGAVGIPEGADDSWYEVRIPAAGEDVDGGVDWTVDFTGALDLDLLVAILEPRPALLAQTAGTVRKVAVVDDAEPPSQALAADVAEPGDEVVQAVEVVESGGEVVQSVEVLETTPVVHTTVYRVVDRPVYTYSTSWIYDPARYYVFRGHGGWTYRYFPGIWDWRYYDLSFRLPHHHHRDRHHDRRSGGHDRHRSDRHRGDRDRHRFDRDERRGDRRRGDRRRGDRDRDGRERDRDRRGERRRGSDVKAIVSRPTPRLRRVDPTHPRSRIARGRNAAPRDREDSRNLDSERQRNPRLRADQGTVRRPDGDRSRERGGHSANRPNANPRSNPFRRRDLRSPATTSSTGASIKVVQANEQVPKATDRERPSTNRNARSRAFERRRSTGSAVSRDPVTPRQPVVTRNGLPGSQDPRGNARTRVFSRRDGPLSVEADAPRQATATSRRSPDGNARLRQESRVNPRVRGLQGRVGERTPVREPAARTATRQPPSVTRAGQSRAREGARPPNVRSRALQREVERRASVRSPSPTAERRPMPASRRPAPSPVVRQRPTEDRSNARTRAFQRRPGPSAVTRAEPRQMPVRSQRRQTVEPPARSARAKQVSARPAPSQRAARAKGEPSGRAADDKRKLRISDD